MHTITVKKFIDSAHRLPDTEFLATKKCAELHGHTYLVKVRFGAENTQAGMVVDFKTIKDLIDKLDHRFINDIFEQTPGWSGIPTTAENIAKYLYEEIGEALTLKDIRFGALSVCVCEGYKGSQSNWVCYYG